MFKLYAVCWPILSTKTKKTPNSMLKRLLFNVFGMSPAVAAGCVK